jgi:hypothetical protein
MLISKSNQKVLLKILNMPEDVEAEVHDFVPSLFKYHSSFYLSIKDILPLLKIQKRDKRNVFHLTLKGQAVAEILDGEI